MSDNSSAMFFLFQVPNSASCSFKRSASASAVSLCFPPNKLRKKTRKQLLQKREKSKCSTISRNHFTELVADFLTDSMLPLSVIKQPAFNKLIAEIQPELKTSSNLCIAKQLEKKFLSSKNALKHSLVDIEFVATTADCWTVYRHSYLCVTVHWLSQDTFERKSGALAIRRLFCSRTCNLITDKLQDIHSEYGIKSKVVNITTDCGSNFIKPFSVFLPSEDEMEVHITDISKILTTTGHVLEHLSHQKCAANLLNLVCTTDCVCAEDSSDYKNISQAAFTKCQVFWNKQSLINQEVENENSFQSLCPSATKWKSIYEAIKQLNDYVKAEGNEALNNKCQRFDISRYCNLFILFYLKHKKIKQRS